MKKAIVRAGLALGVIGFVYFIVGAIFDYSMSSRSKTMCSGVRPGMPESQVAVIASENGGWYRPSTGSLGATGFHYMCRCHVETHDGEVRAVGQLLCID